MGDIIAPIAEVDAYFDVYSQAKYFKSFVRVYLPNTPFPKLKPGLESIDLTERFAEPDKSRAESNLERSIRRTKSNIKDITFCNAFDLFVTITIALDRQNLEHSKQKLTSWIKNEKFRKGNFEYLIVPEFHKDQESLHFHGLFKDYKGEVRQSINSSGRPRLQKGRQVFTLPSFTSGFTNVKKIDNSIGSIAKVSFYLQKYITKDMPILFGKNRYRASYGLKRPVVQDNPEPWYKLVQHDRKYEVEEGVILEFDAGKSALVDMFLEANQP